MPTRKRDQRRKRNAQSPQCADQVRAGNDTRYADMILTSFPHSQRLRQPRAYPSQGAHVLAEAGQGQAPSSRPAPPPPPHCRPTAGAQRGQQPRPCAKAHAEPPSKSGPLSLADLIAFEVSLGPAMQAALRMDSLTRAPPLRHAWVHASKHEAASMKCILVAARPAIELRCCPPRLTPPCPCWANHPCSLSRPALRQPAPMWRSWSSAP